MANRPITRWTRAIGVDFTPMLPAGSAGGLKVMAIDLVRRLHRLAPERRFVLLASRRNRSELESLFPTIEILQVWPGGYVSRLSRGADLLRYSAASLSHLVRSKAARTLNRAGVATARRSSRSPTLRGLGIEVLFCPFTAVTYAEPGLGVVSVVYDVQHLIHPEFFDPREVSGRNAQIAALKERADIVVSISEHARQGFVDFAGIPQSRTQVIPVAIHDRLPRLSSDAVSGVLERLRVAGDYALYPANGWPHKNHRRLLEAYATLRRRRPDLSVDLVFTGTFGAVQDDLRALGARLGVQSSTHWVGYRDEHELAALYERARMVVFPSLYEGFGIPVLEAMWFGKPVACSNTTSLPEVAGDAARYFDPEQAESIADAMEDVLTDPALSAGLAERGRQRVSSFTGDAMAAAYLRAFDDVPNSVPPQ